MATILGLFPPAGDFRFTPVDPEIPLNYQVGNMPSFDQKPYNDSAQDWQTPMPYQQKKTFQDPCTVYVQTARATTSPTPPIYPYLELVDVCETVAISLMPYVNGAQRIANNTFTQPGTSTAIPLDSFSWKFNMGLVLDPSTRAGTYKLRMTIYGNEAMTEYKVFESEPIIVFDSFPNTALLQAWYSTNNSFEGIITGGWTDGLPLYFFTRVECSMVDFNLQGILVGYYQQNWLELPILDRSWRCWNFILGGAAGGGVPDYMLEKVDKLLGTGNMLINGKSYVKYENSESPKFAWSKTDPQASGLIWASIPIRERYSGENVFVFITPTPDLEIFEATGYPFAIPEWSFSDGAMSFTFDPAIIDNSGEYDAYKNALNATVGLLGAFSRTSLTLNFTPSTGLVPSVYGVVDLLYTEFNPKYSPFPTGGTNGFRVRGFDIKLVVDWGDGTDVEYYNFPDFLDNPIPHTFTGSLSEYNARVFYNENFVSLEFIETGSPYPVAAVFLLDVTGTLPVTLAGLDISQCNSFAFTTAGVASINVSPLIALQALSFRNNASLQSFATTPFALPMPVLSYIEFKNNQFDSTVTDDLIIDFATNSWDGVLASGTITIQNSPAAAPTAASLAERTALAAESWTQLYDP